MKRLTPARRSHRTGASRRRLSRTLVVALAALGLMTSTVAAAADSPPVSEAVETFEWSDNMNPLGFSERVPVGGGDFNSDLAFRGDHAFQGTYSGFRILDVSDPTDPVEVSEVDDCGVSRASSTGQQGDVIVYEDILVRSWDGGAGGQCQDLPGQSGLHVFDISDLTEPVAVGNIDLQCGSHTATGVPDPDNGRLLVYSSPQSGGCNGIDIVEVPLADPSDVEYIRFLPSGDPAPAFPNLVTVDEPSDAAGDYIATGAAFGMGPDEEGVSGDLVVVNDGSANPAEGCGELVDFPEDAIALADRGTCPFLDKALNAQAAGAVGLVVVNNTASDPITLGGSDPDHEVMIPAGMVSQADGNAIKDGLPAAGRFFAADMPDEPARACHDTGVILGDVMRAACAGHDGVTAWSLDPADGGSLDDPVRIWYQSFEGVSIGHSAAWTWDGEVLVFGHEPGGGGQARCQETSADIDRTLFFLDGETGETIGTLLHPRPQGPTENCTWHNYNVVPTDKHYTLVSGNYQSGIIVVNFSDPTDPRMVAYADPAPLSETQLITGGDWSSYWYNGHIYQSDIRRGLIIWELDDPHVAGAKELPYLNPQTQETSFGKSPAFGRPGGGVTGPPPWAGEGPPPGRGRP